MFKIGLTLNSNTVIRFTNRYGYRFNLYLNEKDQPIGADCEYLFPLQEIKVFEKIYSSLLHEETFTKMYNSFQEKKEKEYKENNISGIITYIDKNQKINGLHQEYINWQN